jgi:hypothetical protein
MNLLMNILTACKMYMNNIKHEMYICLYVKYIRYIPSISIDRANVIKSNALI